MYKKIMICGMPGAGKSTFAHALHKKMGIPLHHLDKYLWSSHWKKADRQTVLDTFQSMIDSDCWIIEGNSNKLLEDRFEKADIVLYFNYARLLCFWRIFKRLIWKNKEIDDRAPFCHEKVSWKLIQYLWNFNDEQHSMIMQLKQKYSTVRFIEICSDQDAIAVMKLLT